MVSSSVTSVESGATLAKSREKRVTSKRVDDEFLEGSDIDEVNLIGGPTCSVRVGLLLVDSRDIRMKVASTLPIYGHSQSYHLLLYLRSHGVL